jgi:hypothetical protein
MRPLSRQCRILNISQPYRPPGPVNGIALLYFTYSQIKYGITSKLNEAEHDFSFVPTFPLLFCPSAINSGLVLVRPLLLSSGQEFLVTDPEVPVRFPALPDFLRNRGSGTGSSQPREYN